MEYSRIKELPPEERPRERFMQYGPDALSDSELLAIMLRTGTKNASAMALATQLIKRFETLKGIASASLDELCELEGVGPAKAIQIKAAFEIGKRFAKFRDTERTQIRCAEDVRKLLWHDMRMHQEERFMVVLLDTKNRVIKTETVTVGILDSSLIHPREVFRNAVKSNAASVILAHNHPSGDPAPSKEDERTTKRLCEAGELMGISVLDHVVIGERGHFSFKEHNKM